MRYEIHTKQINLYAHNVSYTDRWMQERFISVDIESPTPLQLENGDYIEYLGERFSIYDAQSVMKQARRGSYGGAFMYKGVRFDSTIEELKQIRFKDLVRTGATTPYYVTSPKFSLHCDDYTTLLDKIMVNIVKYYDDRFDATKQAKEVWEVVKGSGEIVSATNVDLEFSNNSVWEALQMITTKFKTSIVVKGYKIIVGSEVGTKDKTMRYGMGNGLVSIERVIKNDQDLVTRLRVYGSTKNMPSNYYSDIFEPDVLFYPAQKYQFFAFDDEDMNYPRYQLFLPFLPGETPERNIVRLRERIASSEPTTVQLSLNITLPSNCESVRIREQGENDFTTYKVFDGTSEGITIFKDFTVLLSDWMYSDDSGVHYKKSIVVRDIPLRRVLQYKKNWMTDRVLAPVGLAVNNLMLPSFPSDVDPHIDVDADTMAKYGLREGVVTFDNESVGDIYPTIQGMTAETLRAAGYTIDIPEGDNGRMDEILWCDLPDDNGYISNTATGEELKKQDWFYIYIKDIGFNIANYTSDTNPQIQMMSGNCGGRVFTMYDGSANPRRVRVAYKNTTDDYGEKHRECKVLADGEDKPDGFTGVVNAWEIKLKREPDNEIGIYFPNNIVGNDIKGDLFKKIRPGDATSEEYHTEEFVILSIEMPSLYIKEASMRLQKAAEEYLAKNNYYRSQYNVKIDSLFMQRDVDARGENSLRYSLVAGRVFKFEDADLDPDGKLADEKWFIDSYTIKENGDKLPEYEVVLKQEIELTKLQRLQEQIITISAAVNDLASNVGNEIGSPNKMMATGSVIGGGGSVVGGVSESEVTEIGDKRYARLDAESENVFEGENTFERIVGGAGFATTAAKDGGIEDAGAAMYDDDEGGHIVTDYFEARRVAFFRELTIAEVSHAGGEVVLSAAACQIARVEKRNGDDAFVCYFEKEANGRAVYNEWKVGDLAYCQRWDADGDIPVVDGVNGNADYPTGSHFYWRQVIGTGETYDMWYVVLSDNEREKAGGSMIPDVNDKIVLLGHTHGGYRSTAQIYSTIGAGAPSRRNYYGITTFKLPRGFEILDYEGGAHWRVGDDDEYIEFGKDGLEIKAKKLSFMTSGGGMEDVGEVLGEGWQMHVTKKNAPRLSDLVTIAVWIPADKIDPSSGWLAMEYDVHKGDQLITGDGFTYQFVDANDIVLPPDVPSELTIEGYGWWLNSDEYLIRAQESANASAKNLDDMASDNVITRQEKVALKKEYDRLQTEINSLISEASSVKVNVNTLQMWYEAYVTNMLSYILLNMSEDTLLYDDKTGLSLVVNTAEKDKVFYGIPASQPLSPVGNNVSYSDCLRMYVFYQAFVRSDITRQMNRNINDIISSGSDINEKIGKDVQNILDELYGADGKSGIVGTVTNVSEEYIILNNRVKYIESDGTKSWIADKGLVTLDNYAAVFAQAKTQDGTLLSEAIISTSVQYDNQTGKITSNVSLSADKIDFTAQSISAFTQNFRIDSDQLKIYNEEGKEYFEVYTDNFKLDKQGNATFSGTLNGAGGIFNGKINVKSENEEFIVDPSSKTIAYKVKPTSGTAIETMEISPRRENNNGVERYDAQLNLRYWDDTDDGRVQHVISSVLLNGKDGLYVAEYEPGSAFPISHTQITPHGMISSNIPMAYDEEGKRPVNPFIGSFEIGQMFRKIGENILRVYLG